MKRKIYDGFLFFNELDLLEIRLNVLNDVVDQFILVEANVTHQGNPKPFIFEKNKDRFAPFLHKIIHIKIEDTPSNFSNPPENITSEIDKNIWKYINETSAFDKYTQPHFGRIFYQRECIIKGVIGANDEDIIISSDVDEIPNPEILSRLDEFYEIDDLYTFVQFKYCYYLNYLFESHIDNTRGNMLPNQIWHGSRMGSWKILKNYSLNSLRNNNQNEIWDGGWHFSYMGGENIVKEKVLASDGSGYSNAVTQDKITKVNIDDTYPEYIINNLEKYKHLIKE